MNKRIKGFKNVLYYHEEQGLVKGDITITNTRITGFDTNNNDDLMMIEDDLIVVPGFIEEHFHGVRGIDTMDEDVDFQIISDHLAQEGVVRFLPTTMTESLIKLKKTLINIKTAMQQSIGVLGVHLEGPFLSVKKAGAQNSEYMITPSLKTFYEMGGSNTVVKLITIAPELKNSIQFIKQMKKQGILVNLGHSNARFDETKNAINNGANGFTHLFNAMTMLHHRDIGIAGCALIDDEAYVEVIADGIHLSIPTLKLIFKCKPHRKIVLITDSMRAKGMIDGIYELGGQMIKVNGGEARTSNNQLAGSVLKMNDALRFLKNNLFLSFCELIDLATLNVAHHLQISDHYGSIKIGKKADFTIIDRDFNVYYTIRDGQIIYAR